MKPLHALGLDRATLIRTAVIALVAGIALAAREHQISTWPRWVAFAYWFSLGGHWVELLYLKRMRPRFGAAKVTQSAVRVVTWFAFGFVLMAGARFTGLALGIDAWRMPPTWLGGVALVLVELAAHAVLAARGAPNFFTGEPERP